MDSYEQGHGERNLSCRHKELEKIKYSRGLDE